MWGVVAHNYTFLRGSVEQEVGGGEGTQGSQPSHPWGIELLADGIEEQEGAGAEQRVDEPGHTKEYTDRQEARPSWRIFAVVATIIHNVDMSEELAMYWRGDGELPMAENVRLHQI